MDLMDSYFHDDLYRANDFLRPTPRAIHRAVEGSNWDWPKARRIRALPDTRTRVFAFLRQTSKGPKR